MEVDQLEITEEVYDVIPWRDGYTPVGEERIGQGREVQKLLETGSDSINLNGKTSLPAFACLLCFACLFHGRGRELVLSALRHWGVGR